MASEDMTSDELIEERPAPGTLIRHRGATLDVRAVERGSTSIELRQGAVWVRATPDGAGLVVTHGAATVQVRDGAAVVEVHDFEALLVVIAGRAAIKGAAALPRSVSAGQAVTLTLDGSFGDPEDLVAGELAADRMVVENLALDALGSESRGPGRSASVTPAPRPLVDGPPPGAPPPESSALQAALAGVGVSGSDADARDVAAAPVDPAPAEEEAEEKVEPGVEEEAEPGVEGDVDDGPLRPEAPMSPTSRRLLVALIIVAIIVVAVVAALVVSGDDSEGAEAGSAVLLPAESIESTEAPSATEDDAPSRTPSEVEAAIDECRFRADGYSIRGTVSGGGQLVARYEVTVAVVDGDGEAYAEVTERVVPSDDRARPADFEASVPLAADEVRDDSACEVVDAEPLRIAPR